MQLTPEQIAGLPPDQQAQVIALQEHMVRALVRPLGQPGCAHASHALGGMPECLAAWPLPHSEEYCTG